MHGLEYSFIDGFLQKSKTLNVFIHSKSLYYLTLHLRFSTFYYPTQLVDIFSYEVLNLGGVAGKAGSGQTPLHKSQTSVIVYNLHSMLSQDRFFVYTYLSENDPLYNSRLNTGLGVASIAELFSAANWLEREASELSGIGFLAKKDLRNLMLPYGDSTSPLQKSFPSIGLKEMFYEPVKDTLVQNPVALQL